MKSRFTCLMFCLFLLPAISSTADDWPQWLGPKRDSVWRETGIVERFPDDGLKVKWRAEVGMGYSGPAVADGRVFVMDYQTAKPNEAIGQNNPGGRTKLEGTERVVCFDADSGNVLWKHAYEQPYSISYAAGPRCTPTVDGDRVYSLGAEGKLLCLKADDGEVVWQKDLKKEYKTTTPMWGFSAHPLVDGNTLYCVVGGKGSVAVAFDKMTGRELWRAISANEPGYCPPTMIEHAGTKQLLIWDINKLNSLNPKNGDVYWQVPLKPGYGMPITAPRKAGDLLYASGIGSQSALLQLDSTKPGASELWRGKPKTSIYSCNSTPFLSDGMIYGVDCQAGNFMGVRLSDGERVWETFEPTTGGTRRASHGTAFVVRHEDRYFLFNEKGDLILANLSRKGYEELGRFHVLDPTNECFGRDVVWSHPAFANKSVFARNDKELVCVDLAAD
jgi:outer membrane protein assembly factor BamB